VRTRSSMGTRIGEGVGGAVRAAASAGDWIRLPTNQLATARSVTKISEITRIPTLPNLNLAVDGPVILSGWLVP
jgi:hypothetical protein